MTVQETINGLQIIRNNTANANAQAVLDNAIDLLTKGALIIVQRRREAARILVERAQSCLTEAAETYDKLGETALAVNARDAVVEAETAK